MFPVRFRSYSAQPLQDDCHLDASNLVFSESGWRCTSAEVMRQVLERECSPRLTAGNLDPSKPSPIHLLLEAHLRDDVRLTDLAPPVPNLRKEVIQPQVPLRLPCYDFTPVTSHSLGPCLPCGLAQALLEQPTPMV